MSVELATLLGVVITAAAAVFVAVLNLRQDRKIHEIHVLVNDRLERALARVEELKVEVAMGKLKDGPDLEVLPSLTT